MQAEVESQNYKNTKFVYTKAHTAATGITKFTNRIARRLGLPAAFLSFPYLSDVTKAIGGSDFDCVIVENMAEYVPYLKKKLGIPVYLHLHNDYLYKDYYIADSVVDSCDKIIAVSDYIKDRVLTIKNDAGKVSILRNVIDVDRFAPAAPHVRENLRAEYGINATDTVFTYVGRITPGKGVLELVEAFSGLLEKYDNAKLLIVGATWFSSDTENEYVKKIQTCSDKIKDKIIFTGYVDYGEIVRQYACADVVVVPSVKGEACGLVVLEAMASAKALIVSDSGGIPEHVSPDCAIVVKRGEGFVGGLSCAMESLLLDPNRIKSLGKAGFTLGAAYDKNEYLNRLLDIIDNG
jgi:glycosyltransferase involved in cell wall biosynthesis